MTRTEITELVKTDPKYTVSALLAIYAHQTLDEQRVHSTTHQNGMGFNGTDAGICSDLVSFYHSRGFLTPRQIEFLRKALPKYMGQVSHLEPAPFKEQTAPATIGPEGKPVNLKKVSLTGETIHIAFPYDANLVNQVKTLTGRKWDSFKKEWTAPLVMENVQRLSEWGFELTDYISTWLERAGLAITNPAPAPASSSDPVIPSVDYSTIPGLKGKLFHYQEEGVAFIDKRNGRALVGDEMGLGKTWQALAWLQLRTSARPAIIVVPASLKLNWEREAKNLMESPKVQVLSGRPNGTPLTGEIIIINYDILDAWSDRIVAYKPKAIVTDECHYYKNSKTLRTKAVKKISKGVPHFLALSGTPIVNRPVEMWNAISFVEPKLFPSFFGFAKRYCGAKNNGFGWDFNGSSNTHELHEKLSGSIMIRRLKKDVLKDLPEKMRNVIPMELSNEKEYKRAELDFIQWLTKEFGQVKAQAAKRAEALVRIESLKQLAVKGKMDEAVEWIADFLESGEKLVVFAVHKNVIDAVMAAFPGISVKVDGSCSQEQRQAAVDSFQNNPDTKLFVGNIKAAGVGLTLTEASNTCFLELGWTPGDHDQAEDRVHRIGQTADSVNAWYLLAAGTIEEDIAKLIDVKRKVLAMVLDGQEVSEDSMLAELLGKYGKGE